MNLIRRVAANVFIVCFLSLILIDAMPRMSSLHRRLKDGVDVILDKTALWQGEWKLFAPNVDKTNVRITAELYYPGGGQVSWESPDWPTMSIWQKVLKFRHEEYYDNIRTDRFSTAWRSFGDYLARTTPAPDGRKVRPTKIVFTRHWAQIPRPTRGRILPFEPYENFDQKSDYYTWEAAQ
jgi:hypothetical protein